MGNKARKTLLLVEDEILIAMAEKGRLERYGYAVVTAHSGETAIGIIDDGQDIDLVLMDINLGKGIDGTETARIILVRRDIPVIFLSSHTEQEVVEKTENISSYGYVVKSSSITVLDASIKMAFKLFEANAMIKGSEEKQRVMISNITDVLCIVDEDGTIRYQSPNVQRLFGWEPRELIGTKAWLLIHPDDIGALRGDYWLLRDSETSTSSVDCRYKCGDGTYKTVNMTTMNLVNDPIIHGILINYHDISERRKAERAIQASETRYRRLFESAQDGILILDAETGRIVDVNPFLIELLGYPKEEFVAKAIWEIGFFKDILANKGNFLELQEKEYVRYENLPLETSRGETLEVEFISNVYLVDDQKVIQCNIREISARKVSEGRMGASELRFRRLFETTQTGILILDARTGMIMDVNPFLIDMLGYSKEQFVEKAIWEIGFLKDIVANKGNLLELQEKKFVRYEDLPLETAFGRTIDVEFISNLYEVDGLPVIQCNIRDITERIQTGDLLRKSFREKSELYRELQHRVKNSFALISALISLAQGKDRSPETVAALTEIDNRVRSMSELYSLLYSSGSFAEVHLDEYFSKLASALIRLSDKISLVTDMEVVVVSAKQAAPLGLILTELITNAQKYAFPDGRSGKLNLSLKRSPEGARLEVGDDGIGNAKETKDSGSAGIGIKLVESLTRQVGGSFRMTQDEGGTRCILNFALTMEE